MLERMIGTIQDDEQFMAELELDGILFPDLINKIVSESEEGLFDDIKNLPEVYKNIRKQIAKQLYERGMERSPETEDQHNYPVKNTKKEKTEERKTKQDNPEYDVRDVEIVRGVKTKRPREKMIEKVNGLLKIAFNNGRLRGDYWTGSPAVGTVLHKGIRRQLDEIHIPFPILPMFKTIGRFINKEGSSLIVYQRYLPETKRYAELYEREFGKEVRIGTFG